MSYTSQLQIYAPPERLIELRDDCVELSAHDCGDCPLLGRCAIHVRLTRAMNQSFQERKMTFVRNVTGKNWSATALRKEQELVVYTVATSDGRRPRVSVPAETASSPEALSLFLEQHIAQGTNGARVLCG